MTRITDSDRVRVVRLLETMRDLEAPHSTNLELAVFGRLRTMGRPRSWNPVLTLKEFGLAAAAAIAVMALGGAGVINVTSPEWLSAPRAGLRGFVRLLGTLAGALLDVVGAVARPLLDTMSRLTEKSPYLDNSLSWAAEAALLVFGAMLVLTVIVVFHEARSRRLAA